MTAKRNIKRLLNCYFSAFLILDYYINKTGSICRKLNWLSDKFLYIINTYSPLIIGFSILLAYQNSFFVPFIFDDDKCIINNPHIRHLWPLWEALSRPF